MSPEPGGLQPQHPDLQPDQVHLRQRQEVHRRRLRDLALSLAGRGRLQPRSATGAPQEEGRTEGERSVLPGERSEQRHERELRCHLSLGGYSLSIQTYSRTKSTYGNGKKYIATAYVISP
ncbi:uncharacterized protein O3Q21_013872 [Podargus strigoides]